jgi:hypothetical protein
MKMTKIFAIMLALTGVFSQANWGRPLTQEEIDKRNIDLRYQEKQSHVEQKKANVTAEASKKQQNLNYEKSQIKLQRERDLLKNRALIN